MFIARLDDFIENPQLLEGLGVSSVQPRMPNKPAVDTEETSVPDQPGVRWMVFSTKVACTRLVISR